MHPSPASYLPHLLQRRLASPVPLAAPEARATPAAVMLSDISGFTTLVETFARAGAAGLEELTWSLNDYFATLVDTVYAHGGDVLCIAGDGFLSAWPAETDDDVALNTAVTRALEAGLAIQAALHDRPAGRGEAFRTRVVVSAGELVTAFVGGHTGRWELVAEGAAVASAAAAGARAPEGLVLATPDAWARVSAHCSGEACDGGTLVSAVPVTGAVPRAGLPILAPGTLHPFIPLAVRDRLDMPDATWLAELRPVSVLMLDLPTPLAANGALARLHACVAAFQALVAHFEGTARVDVDDKGALLLAVWGLPPLAHENDAERAVAAARALQDELQRLGVKRGIGVATGRALCGAFGSDRRRDYIVRGDAINLAARLMRRSADDVTCDEATVQATRGRVEFVALDPVLVKGRAQPIPVFLARARQHAATVRAPMVGRAPERAQLRRSIDAVARGDGGVVLIEGEAGLGKSRLLEEAAAQAAAAGVHVLTAAADAIENATPYFAWRAVFATIFGVHAGMEPTAARARVAAYMAALPAVAKLVPLLNAVLPLQLPESELTAQMTGEVRADNTVELLSAILRRESERTPTVLRVEDAHWLDSGSWSVLLAAAGAPALLVIASTRPLEAPVPPAYPRLASRAAAVLRLEGLARAELETLIAQRLAVREVPARLTAFVHGRVAGHPFFCEELLHALQDAGSVRVQDDACILGDLDAAGLPTTVEGVILSRLDRLSTPQLACLKIAAVIGRTFLGRAVAVVHPQPEERPQVPRHLRDVARLDLTVPEAPEPDPSYAFRHVITRDVTYELMPVAQRQPLHRGVAQWYEETHAADLSPHYALLAFHWARAADAARTATYLELAGAQALRGGAFQQAVHLFTELGSLEHAGRIDADAARRALWEKGLGTAHYFLGDMERSRAHLERAVALVDRPIPRAPAAVLRGVLAAALRQVAHRRLPARYLARRAGEKAVLDEIVDCYKVLGQIYYLDGEPPPRLVYCTLRGLNLGEEAGPSPGLARILSNTATLLGLLGFNRWADGYGERAVAIAEREGQYAAGAYVWSILALREAQLGRWAAARAANARSLELVRELGDFNIEAEGWVVRATVLICAGEFAAAPDAWRRARELAERNGNRLVHCWSLLDEVDTLLGRDDTEAAAAVLERALAIETAPSDGGSTIDKHRALAVTRLRQRRYAEAVVAADVVLHMITSSPPTGYHWVDYGASAVEVLIDALAADGDHGPRRDALERRARRGCRMLLRLARNFHNVRPRAWLLRGRLHALEGRMAAAARDWRRAVEIATAMAMPYERARALLELARHGIDRDGLAEARAIFAELGADYLLRQADATSAPLTTAPTPA